ncbi:MAG: hypothetical protein GQ583_04480 [Methyloprofundus sp.]|nr:hypothetical protein [Methyloprofundus sp.]
MIKRIQYGSIQLCFWTLLLLAIAVSGLRLALSELNFFRTEIETQLSKQLGEQISIERISGVLNGIKPELALYNIRVHSRQNNDTALQLNEVRLGLNILSALQHSLLEAIQISVMGARLSVTRLPSGNITIKGLPNSDNQQQPTWLMRGGHYKLIDSNINWHDEKRNARPIQLKHVNISIDNEAQQHKIFISTDLSETLGQSLHLAMDFNGDIFTPDSVNAKLFVQGKDLELAKIITGDLPFDFSITKGRGDFSLWSTWKATQMTQMSGSILMSDAEIKDTQNNRFPIEQLELPFKLQKQQQQWHLALENAHLSTQKNNLDIAALSVALALNDAGDLSHLALNCPQLNIGQLSSMMTLHKILPENRHLQLQNLAPEGQVQDLLFVANPAQEIFAISAQFNQLHTQPINDIPGIKGLSLYIEGTEKQGKIQLSSQQMTLKSPLQFRRALHFNHVLGELDWHQQADTWVISSPMLELHTADIKTKNKFQLSLNKDQPASMNLQSHFYEGYDAAQIRHYLPVDIINDDALLDWLDHAFIAGSVPQGDVLFRGALKDYPFTKADGVFEVLFNAKNVDLHYADEWQNMENLAAEIRFFSESLEVNIRHGLVNEASIKHAKVKIHSFSNSDSLSIKGNMNGDLAQAIGFLKQTPYKEQISTLNTLLDMRGPFSAAIDLEIPLQDIPAKINIIAAPQNAQLHIAPADLPVTNINGKLHITDKGIFSENLSASILGFPVTADIDSKENNTHVLLSGETDIKHLARQFPSPLWPYLSGASHYQLRLNAPRDTRKNTRLQLSAGLKGVKIDFPPLSKTKTQIRPFSLDLSMNNSGINSLNIDYKNLLTPENSLDIKLKKILPHWQGLIHSPLASGSVFIPIDFNKNSNISLLFEELNLSALGKIDLKSRKTSFSPHDFPGMTLKSQAVYWKNHNLGELNLLTEPSADGLLIKQLAISSAAADELNLTGHWQQTKSGQKTSIEGNFLSLNFGHLLQQLKLSENIIDSNAELQFSLNWPGTVMDLSRQTLNGTVHAYLTQGRILGVEPGLGRILGALDTQKLFKRLRFDFSDITAEGLSFSEITADISIRQGLVSTENFYINAMPAKINLAGSTHLATREVNLLVTVLPKFPIAGTIIGNAANTFTKTLVGDQHAGGLILSLLYKIKGTWDEVTVKRQFSPALTEK